MELRLINDNKTMGIYPCRNISTDATDRKYCATGASTGVLSNVVRLQTPKERFFIGEAVVRARGYIGNKWYIICLIIWIK